MTYWEEPNTEVNPMVLVVFVIPFAMYLFYGLGGLATLVLALAETVWILTRRQSDL